MSKHSYAELVSFAAMEAAKPFDERVCFARVLDFDIHKTRWPDTFNAFQFLEDCVRWGDEHSTPEKIPDDSKPGNMKVRVFAASHVPKGISPWLDLEQIPAWKAGKIQE